MKFKKIVVFINLASLYNCFGMQAPAQSEHLSITSSISAHGFATLEKAFQEIQPQLRQSQISVSAFPASKYHMTLLGFDIYPQNGLSGTQKKQLKDQIELALENATTDAIKKSLAHLKQINKGLFNPITLRFAYISIFKTKVVAIFEITPVIQTFVNTIENYFHSNLNNSKLMHNIQKIEKHQKILQPHVSLAQITQPHSSFGVRLTPKTHVADFLISKPEHFVSAQWRTAKAPAPISRPLITPQAKPSNAIIPAAQPAINTPSKAISAGLVDTRSISTLARQPDGLVIWYSKLSPAQKNKIISLIPESDKSKLESALRGKLISVGFSAPEIPSLIEQYLIEQLISDAYNNRSFSVNETLTAIHALKPCSREKRQQFLQDLKRNDAHRFNHLRAYGKLLCSHIFEWD